MHYHRWRVGFPVGSSIQCIAIALTLFGVCNSSFAQHGDIEKGNTKLQENASLSPHANMTARLLFKAKPLAHDSVTSSWPTLLGPALDGTTSETKLLKRWPQDGPKLVWEMETGTGYAPPAVSGDRLVYFHRVDDQDVVECLQSETGKRHWRYTYLSAYVDRYGFNNGPRCGPVIDGNLVYVYGATGALHCLELATGNLLWKHDIAAKYSVPQGQFGFGSAPLVQGDLLIVQVGAPDGPSVVAFDKRSGSVRWKTDDEWGASYATPIPMTVQGEQRVLVFAGGDSRPPTGGLLSVDPANGHVDFRFPFRSKRYESVNASSPVVVKNHVFLSTSYRTGGVMLDMTKNNPSDNPVVWRTNDLGCHFMTPIHREGYLYGVDGSSKRNSAIVCLDWKTGKLLWRKQPEWNETVMSNGEKKKVSYSIGDGSLIWADGYFLCLSDKGHLLWLDLSPDGYKEIARTWLFSANETFTPPVVSRGLLYVTQNEPDLLNKSSARLLCYDLRDSS